MGKWRDLGWGMQGGKVQNRHRVELLLGSIFAISIHLAATVPLSERLEFVDVILPLE